MVSGGQKLGVTAKHVCCAGPTWYIQVEEEEIEKSCGVNLKRDVVTCEIPFGGVLLFNNCIPHRSLENFSNKIRWSLDLRWVDPNKSIGFFGLKEPVVMRKAGETSFEIEWESECFAIITCTLGCRTVYMNDSHFKLKEYDYYTPRMPC